MGLGFSKRINIGNGLFLNLSKGGVSLSMKMPLLGTINLKNGKVNYTKSLMGMRYRKTFNMKGDVVNAKP